MKKWFVYGKKADFQELGEKLSLDPVLVRILRNRDLTTEEEMRNFLEGEEIPSPLFLPDSIRFLNRLERAMKEGEKVRIVGDYDVDGVCASTILAKALSLFFSKEQLSVVIPHRILDGYGINEQIIEEAKAEEISLLITCDNGISAFSAMEKAKSYGMDVLLTDHHDLRRDEEGKKRIPEAFAVVNPKREGSKYPNEEICGAMVCYLLMKMLLEKRQKGLELLEELACFAGIATVCDVMPLQKENRVIVKYCLAHLQKTQNIGMQALLKQCHILPEQEISSYTLGFQIGPCINAGGRLESAMLALSLFLEEDEGKAEEKAAHLLVLNEEQKGWMKRRRWRNRKEMCLCCFWCFPIYMKVLRELWRDGYGKPIIVPALSLPMGRTEAVKPPDVPFPVILWRNAWRNKRNCCYASEVIPWRPDFPLQGKMFLC